MYYYSQVEVLSTMLSRSQLTLDRILSGQVKLMFYNFDRKITVHEYLEICLDIYILFLCIHETYILVKLKRDVARPLINYSSGCFYLVTTQDLNPAGHVYVDLYMYDLTYFVCKI